MLPVEYKGNVVGYQLVVLGTDPGAQSVLFDVGLHCDVVGQCVVFRGVHV